MAKQIAKTLTGLMNDDFMLHLLSRKNTEEIIDEVENWYGYNLYERKPAPAYNYEGIFQGTDLDLACILDEFLKQGMTINIPYYEKSRATTHRDGEVVTSCENRHGPIMKLGANKELLSFSVTINDANVMTSTGVGEPRTFILTDFGGNMYQGWSTINFIPSKEMSAYFENRGIWSGNKIYVKNFVHPARALSFFGQYYIKTKATLQVAEELRDWYKDVMNRMIGKGITYPSESGFTPNGNQQEWGKTTVDTDTKTITIKAFEAMLYIPGILPHPAAKVTMRSQSAWDKLKTKNYESREAEFWSKKGEAIYADNDAPWFIDWEDTQTNLVEITKRYKKLRYKTIPRLRFLTRAVELAYLMYGKERLNESGLPHWIKGTNFESGFKLPGGKNEWERLALSEKDNDDFSVSLLKRVYEKTETVNQDYEQRPNAW